jgi:GNAT superfamily N-acetyltransferase
MPAYARQFPDPISVLVLTQPFPDISARSKATANFFHQYDDAAENLKMLNKFVLYLARLITDPRYLRKGLATFLLKETLKRLTIPMVETLTPIDFTNRMYTNAGFKLYYTPASRKYVRLMNAFKQVGLDVRDTTSHKLIDMRLELMPHDKKQLIEKEIVLFLAGYRNAQRFKPGPERTKFILSKVPPPEAYLLWHNPRNELASEAIAYRESSLNKNNQQQ